MLVVVKFCGVGDARTRRWAWWKIFVVVVSLVLMLMLVLIIVLSFGLTYDCGISLTCICYLLYYPPHSHSSALSFCPIHIPPTNKPPFNQTISPPISLYLSNITSHHLTPPNLSITRPNRSSAELVPEVVSPRSESNSWTTLTDPSSETSRAPCESMTFWRFWSLSERLGEFFFSVFPSSYLPLISSRVVSVGGCLGGRS